MWTRGGELVTDKYPEYAVLQQKLKDGTVLDGEILPFKNDRPMSLQELQTRIGRKSISKKLLESTPVVFKSYDVMEYDGKDIRTEDLKIRRQILELVIASVAHPVLQLSENVPFKSWDELLKLKDASREFSFEGLMLKRKDSAYHDGRKRGDWWKCKVDPLVINAVLIYAMRGHGRRANLNTDYTFAVWDDGMLVPFSKADSGLTNKEILEVDRFVKQNTVERFGPVRSVSPQLVFEIAFEGINRSKRHKSGVALRLSRISRWRKDKITSEANNPNDLYALLPK